jgi:molybdopterin molybdotransferase
MSDSPLTKIAQQQPGYDANALSVTDAQAIINSLILPIKETEKLPLKQVLNRILANDIISPINVPPHDNAAMDGYAFASTELKKIPSVRLQVIGSAYAGKPYTGTVTDGACIRIMTGAQMPARCDTVIPLELTQNTAITTSAIEFNSNAVQAGDNRRHAGEDLAKDKPALIRGKQLSAADMGLIGSLGIGEVSVIRKLRIAYFSTGDELRSIGEPLPMGCVYDSNSYTLFGMLTRLGVETIDMGVIKDDPASIEAALKQACASVDAIITSGGVSGGDADYTRAMMSRLGEVLFWKIAMRPGRPMAFGKISSNNHSAWLFGLPGNPVAVMVTFYFFVQNALRQMMGTNTDTPITVKIKSAEPIRKKPGRTEYQRGIVSTDQTGKQTVRITGSQGSGILSSMSEANCMVVLPHQQHDVPAGDMVDVILFEGLV